MMLTRTLITFAVCLVTPIVVAADINGFWKHPKAPAWIEINLDEGKGTVIRNDQFPERVGREVLKDLEADDSESNLWHGQLYVEKLGEYRNAQISLPDPGRMEFNVKVGFMSRTIEWLRVEEVPTGPAK